MRWSTVLDKGMAHNYLLTLDLATVTGWSIWDCDCKEKVGSGSHNFCDKDYRKLFQGSTHDDKMLEKVAYLEKEVWNFFREILRDIGKLEDEEDVINLHVIIEYSVFGFRYSIQKVTELFTLIMNYFAHMNWDFLDYDSIRFVDYEKNENCNVAVQVITPGTWREIYHNEPELLAKFKNKRKTDWKKLALSYCQKLGYDVDVKDNDQAEAILIGVWYFKNKKNKKER